MFQRGTALNTVVMPQQSQCAHLGGEADEARERHLAAVRTVGPELRAEVADEKSATLQKGSHLPNHTPWISWLYFWYMHDF